MTHSSGTCRSRAGEGATVGTAEGDVEESGGGDHGCVRG